MPNVVKQIEKPNSIQKLGNNTYYYNYNILPTKVMGPDEKEVDGWKFVQVHLYGQPDYNSCVKAIIREFVTQEEEFDLINSYNSYQLKINLNVKALDNYKEYLEFLDQIKSNVKNDLN